MDKIKPFWVIFKKNFKKSVFKNQKCPNFALGQMMILSKTRNFNLHLFSKQDEKSLHEKKQIKHHSKWKQNYDQEKTWCFKLCYFRRGISCRNFASHHFWRIKRCPFVLGCICVLHVSKHCQIYIDILWESRDWLGKTKNQHI